MKTSLGNFAENDLWSKLTLAILISFYRIFKLQRYRLDETLQWGKMDLVIDLVHNKVEIRVVYAVSKKLLTRQVTSSTSAFQ